ncbi:hypothetical protein PMAYCL1PPCAC_30296, partial [Pristionchus mayeri]
HHDCETVVDRCLDFLLSFSQEEASDDEDSEEVSRDDDEIHPEVGMTNYRALEIDLNSILLFNRLLVKGNQRPLIVYL